MEGHCTSILCVSSGRDSASLQSDRHMHVGHEFRVVHIAARHKLMGYSDATFEPKRPRGSVLPRPLRYPAKHAKAALQIAVLSLSCQGTSCSTRLSSWSVMRLISPDFRGSHIYKSRPHSVTLVSCGAVGALGVRCSAQSGRAGQRRGSELRPWPRHSRNPEPGYFLPDCNRDPGSWSPQYLSLGQGATFMRLDN